MDKDIIIIVREFAEQMVETEHDYFVKKTIDNNEHIPRIIRIAESVKYYLSNNNISIKCCEEMKEIIIDYGRNLFIKEWMDTYDDDEEDPVEKDAINEFNKYVNRKKKHKLL